MPPEGTPLTGRPADGAVPPPALSSFVPSLKWARGNAEEEDIVVVSAREEKEKRDAGVNDCRREGIRFSMS